MANESAATPGAGMQPGGNGGTSGEPRSVNAGRGASWWSEGWRLYTPSWGIWLLILVILVVITVCLNFIPFLGHLIVQLINPILFGGLMLGCRAIDHGEKLTINHLFAGFSGHAASLLIVGLVYLVAIIAIVLVVAGVLFAFFGVAVLKQLAELGDSNMTGFALGSMFMAIAVGVLLFLALLLPLVMSVWFAPALVVLRGAEPLAAMKLSLLGCARNIVPFLVYGVIGILLAIVASIPLMLGWLVLGPMTIASIYAGYCDIFEDAAAAH